MKKLEYHNLKRLYAKAKTQKDIIVKRYKKPVSIATQQEITDIIYRTLI